MRQVEPFGQPQFTTNNVQRRRHKNKTKTPNMATLDQNNSMDLVAATKRSRKRKDKKKKTLGLGKRRRLSELSSDDENVSMQTTKGGNYEFVMSGINRADVTVTDINDEMVSEEIPPTNGGSQVAELTLVTFMNNAKVNKYFLRSEKKVG